ncbi:MAG: AI-2E family transporter [Clostridiaceae bacterium]
MNKFKELSIKELFILFVSLIIIYLIMSNPLFWDALSKAFKPIFAAFCVAYILDHIICFMSKKFKISRKKSIPLVIILVIVLFISLGAIIVPSFTSIINDFVDNIKQNTNISSSSLDLGILKNNDIIASIYNYLQNSLQSILSKLADLSSVLLESVLNGVMIITSSVINIILISVIAIYMLLSKDDLLNRINRLSKAFFPLKVDSYLRKSLKKADIIFSSFFIGKILDSALIGILYYLVMLLFKIPNAPLYALILGITNIIPYVGPYLGSIPCIFFSFLINPISALWVLIIIIAMQQFDSLFLEPRVVGSKVGAEPFWIITGVVIGGALFGVLGMFIGVPMMVFTKEIIEEIVERKLSIKNTSHS